MSRKKDPILLNIFMCVVLYDIPHYTNKSNKKVDLYGRLYITEKNFVLHFLE